MKPSPSSLPQAVLGRLDAETRSAVMVDHVRNGETVPVELRTVNGVETRSNDDGTWEVRGYAIVYDYAYDIAGGPERGGWTEVVARGAADAAVKRGDDVRLLFDHGGIPLARTASGTLRLDSEELGLRSVAPSLDQRSPYAQSVRSAVDRRDVDQMSVAMRVMSQTWNDDYTVRTITEVALADVSIVTYPASDATVVQMNAAKPDTERRSLPGDRTYGELQSLLQDELKESFGSDAAWLWVRDFNDDWVVFYSETGTESETYQVGYTCDDAGTVSFTGDPVVVEPRTIYEPEPVETDERSEPAGFGIEYARALAAN